MAWNSPIDLLPVFGVSLYGMHWIGVLMGIISVPFAQYVSKLLVKHNALRICVTIMAIGSGPNWTDFDVAIGGDQA